MKKTILSTFITVLFYSYTYANLNKDSMINFSFGFHNDYSEPMDVKILDSQGSIVFSYETNDRSKAFVPQQSFTKRGNYTILIKHPQKDSIIHKNLYLDASLVSVEIKVAFMKSTINTINKIYVYKHYDNDLGLTLEPEWHSKAASAFKSSIIPNFILTNTHDATIYGIRYHFSPDLLIARAKLDPITYPFIMVYKNSKWTPLDCTPPDMLMDLKKGERTKMQTAAYSICTNDDFNRNNLYKIVVPYCIDNTIEEKIATNFFYTEQKIYKVAEEFIFAKPRIKLKS